MAHSREAMAKGGGMPYFERDHWEKKEADIMVSDLKYGTDFGNPEELKQSVDKLSGYVKKNQMKY